MRDGNLILRLDGMPGSHVKDIGIEMIDVANRLGVIVGVAMNGTRLMAIPGRTTIDDVQRSYEAQIKPPINAALSQSGD